MNGKPTETKDQNPPTAEESEDVKQSTRKNEEVPGENQEIVLQATKDLRDRIAALEGELETKTGVISELEDRLASLSSDYEGAKAAYAYAVDDFKKLASSSNPLLPTEAIYGVTIEEVKASLERGSRLVANVQSFLEEGLAKQAQANSVPAGAPARTSPDTSTMSTKEKINLGLEQARKKKE